MRVLRFARWWIAVGWLLVAGLTVVSLVKLSVERATLPHADKLAHLVCYLLVMAWFAQIWRSRQALAAHVLFLIALGVVLELAQGLTGHRSADPVDALANTGGVLIGRLMARQSGSGLLELLEARLGTPR